MNLLYSKKKLEKYANPKCNDCREGGVTGCSIKGCFINECTKEHKVNFCGECALFPCSSGKKYKQCCGK